MSIRVVSGIEQVDPGAWNALLADDNPFLRHEFLDALESSGCVSPATGWTPHHLLLFEGDRLAGAAPLYLKDHSFGEFVFDWAWADAYERAGGRYYPKLVNAVPFTPSSGPRLLAADAAGRERLAGAIRKLAVDERLSSAHALFVTESDQAAYRAAGFLERHDCQYHWFNAAYSDFDAFLAALTASKRKKIRRERRRVAEAGIRIEPLAGDAIDDRLWQAIYRFYANTYAERGQWPYLNLDFFRRLDAALPGRLLVFVAFDGTRPVAAAITLRGPGTLYGRHWGALDAYHSLHFEACYYQGIEYCIRHGLQRFDAGAQGAQHKLSRGFMPVETRSTHWLGDRRFHRAVEDFLRRETPLVTEHMNLQADHQPYRRRDASS